MADFFHILEPILLLIVAGIVYIAFQGSQYINGDKYLKDLIKLLCFSMHSLILIMLVNWFYF